MKPAPPIRPIAANEPLRFPLIEDNASAGGGMQVVKAVEEATQTVSLPLFQDVVETQRVEIGEVVDHIVAPYQDGDAWVVPVYEEVVVKQLVLKEELRIVRRREQHRHEETVTLKREEVATEHLNPRDGEWALEP